MYIAWLLFITTIVFVVQGQIYRRIGLRHLTYRRYFNMDHAFVGDEVEMVENIANHKWLPLPWLRLESSFKAGLQFQYGADLVVNMGEYLQNHRSLFSLGPHTKIVRRHSIQCTKRGAYQLQTVSFTCGDLFGFYKSYSSQPIDAEFIVYPEIREMQDIPFSSHRWQGDMVVRRWIVSDPFMIAGVREYQPGDAFNSINWKATARTGALQVHQRDFTADHRLMILLNFDVTDGMWNAITNPEIIELGITYAASIAHYAVYNGMEVGFGCNGYVTGAREEPVMIHPATGKEHVMGIYEQMAKLVIDRHCDFPTFMERNIVGQFHPSTDWLLITTHVNDKIQAHIEQLRTQGHGVEIFYLNQEEGVT